MVPLGLVSSRVISTREKSIMMRRRAFVDTLKLSSKARFKSFQLDPDVEDFFRTTGPAYTRVLLSSYKSISCQGMHER